MLQSLRATQALRFVTSKHLENQILAALGNGALEFHILALDVLLGPKGKSAAGDTVEEHPERPDVHLHTIVVVVELWRPVKLRAAALLQTFAWLAVTDCAKVAEVDLALRVEDVRVVHKKVVPFNVSVHDILAVEPRDAFNRSPENVDNFVHRNHSLLLPVLLHALDEIAPLEDVHHHADKDLFKVDIHKPHDRRVSKAMEHLNLTFDVIQRTLHLVDHFDCILLGRRLSLVAEVDYAKGTLANDFPELVFLEKLALRRLGFSISDFLACCLSRRCVAHCRASAR
mmetsp:Transcript_21313/g.47077  ORF Transcript_21313/g.47077 Transcript_21313/m.47077 type:complete len:285 (+) Transcript_21313:1569-2423(+)